MKRILLGSRLRVPVRPNTIHTATPRAAPTLATPPTQPKSEGPETLKSQGVTARPKAAKKTTAQLDQELREKLEMLSGGGGGAGVEYENGKAEGLKRGVKSNMFRVI